MHWVCAADVRWRWRLATLALLVLLAPAWAAPAADRYPALTGRVVDAANIIPAGTAGSIDAKLQSLEDKSGIQVVVATVPSLGGDEIEPFANGLFRFWKLGEARKNNGVLLLVAPNQKKVRIEVGYGLEGTLTDALSKIIITNAIVPRFKAQDFGGGIERGIDDIVAVLSTDSSDWQKRPDLRAQDDETGVDQLLPLLFLVVFVIVAFYISRQTGRRVGARPGGGVVFLPTGGTGWGGGGSFGSGSDSGGGFSGGGGSSGGGGASGGW